MTEETLSKQLLSLKAKTSWSWEKMCREIHRVMGQEGPSVFVKHSTHLPWYWKESKAVSLPPCNQIPAAA